MSLSNNLCRREPAVSEGIRSVQSANLRMETAEAKAFHCRFHGARGSGRRRISISATRPWRFKATTHYSGPHGTAVAALGTAEYWSAQNKVVDMTAPEDLLALKRLLEEKSPDFSKSQKKIASFLLSDHDHAAFMNAAELAERLEVSEATVVRFATAIGFEGFPQLRRFLQNILRDMVSPATRMRNKLDDLRQGEGHILTQVVEMETKSISEIRHTIHVADFDAAVSAILGAERIFLFGIGPSRILADLMQLRLNRFGILTVALVESGRDLLDKLLMLRKGDVVFASAFTRSTGELAAVLTHAEKMECRSVLLTDIADTRLLSCADIVMSVNRGPIHSFHSQTAPMTVINAIILAVAMSDSEASLKSLAELEKYRKEYDLDPIGVP